MDPCANLGCVLKVNVNARSVTCRRKVLEVLHSICGTLYADTCNVRIDWETGLTHITAPVYINLVLHALARSGYKAEVVHINRVQPLPLRPTPMFGRHHIPRHVAFANRLHLRKELGVSFVKEKRLRVNMKLQMIQEKVKEQQEKTKIVVKTAEMHRNELVDNADRWVAGFLEMFEERCHKMGTAIRDRIQKRLRKEQARVRVTTCNGKGNDDDQEVYSDDNGVEEYYESSEKE